MTNNQKRKIKRQAHKEYRKSIIRALRIIAETSNDLQLVHLTHTNPKKFKYVHYRSILHVNRIFRRKDELGKIASRPYEDFFDYSPAEP